MTIIDKIICRIRGHRDSEPITLFRLFHSNCQRCGKDLSLKGDQAFIPEPIYKEIMEGMG